MTSVNHATRPGCLHQLFEASAQHHPQRVALTDGALQVTYADLNAQANRLASHLIHLGVTTETLVGLCMERSADLVVGMLGILKAGGAYLPIDPHAPPERTAFMLNDAGVRVVVTQQHLKSICSPLEVTPVTLPQLPAEASTLNPDVHADPANLAYVIYTSGSTGTPKGVLVEHRQVVRLFQAAQLTFHFNEEDVWTLFLQYMTPWPPAAPGAGKGLLRRAR